MNRYINLFLLLVILIVAGCGDSGKSDLTQEDRKKMDTLFREGIKPGQMETKPPPGSSGSGPASAPALNQPTDG
jgi:hypothetical protein